MTAKLLRRAYGVALFLLASPIAAQDPGEDPRAPESTVASDAPKNVLDGDYISLGLGAAYSSSYDGSDDYVMSPMPFIQGRLAGITINPRPAGIALDFVPNDDRKVAFNLGVAARINRNRASQIEDRVVSQYEKLDTAIEVGPTAGVVLSGLLNPYDSISLGVDVLWDLAGAHNGMTINPSVTYFTPVSRGAAVSLSLSARHVDDDYADYYYSVPVAPANVAVADQLPVFSAQGGIDKLGATLLVGFDLDSDLTNGGLAGFLIGGYSRMQGDGARTPFTAIRGDANQWFLGAGLGYTF